MSLNTLFGELIEIERYEYPKVDAYHVDGRFVGTINNEHEFNRFRINMLKEGVTNQYYFMWGEIKITVNTEGGMSDFPRGLYDQRNKDLAEIFNIQRKKQKTS